MSEQTSEQAIPQGDTPPTQASPPDPSKRDVLDTFDVKLVKRYTGDTHYVEGGTRTELVTHGETGEPTTEYALVATIGGADVTLSSWNAGRLDTIVQAAQKASQQQGQPV